MQRLIRRDVVLVLGVSVAALGGCAMRGPASAPAPVVRPGISVLLTDSIHLIRGKRVGLLTNQTGVDEHGESDIERLRSPEARAAGVQLVRLFSPEHGLYGDVKASVNIDNGVDPRSGLPIYSLFGKNRSPTPAQLKGLEAVVIDLQDIGVRSYTFNVVMRYTLEACFTNNVEVIVLDRPNPLGGYKVDGR